MNKSGMLAASLCAATLLSGCGTAANVADAALELSGDRKPELPESQKPPRKVAMPIAAAKNPNTDSRGRPLSMVVRIYKLKDSTTFYQAPFDAFVTPGGDKTVLGDDLLESREITLLPGQRYDWTESVARQAGAVGVVALFNAPNARRWRFAFDPVESEKTGILIGAHACARTVTRGALIAPQDAGGSADGDAANLLAAVPCKGELR